VLLCPLRFDLNARERETVIHCGIERRPLSGKSHLKILLHQIAIGFFDRMRHCRVEGVGGHHHKGLGRLGQELCQRLKRFFIIRRQPVTHLLFSFRRQASGIAQKICQKVAGRDLGHVFVDRQQPKPLTAHIPERTLCQRRHIGLGDKKVVPAFQGAGCCKQRSMHPCFTHDLLPKDDGILAAAFHHEVQGFFG